jgi:hypothetical protein
MYPVLVERFDPRKEKPHFLVFWDEKSEKEMDLDTTRTYDAVHNMICTISSDVSLTTLLGVFPNTKNIEIRQGVDGMMKKISMKPLENMKRVFIRFSRCSEIDLAPLFNVRTVCLEGCFDSVVNLSHLRTVPNLEFHRTPWIRDLGRFFLADSIKIYECENVRDVSVLSSVDMTIVNCPNITDVTMMQRLSLFVSDDGKVPKFSFIEIMRVDRLSRPLFRGGVGTLHIKPHSLPYISSLTSIDTLVLYDLRESVKLRGVDTIHLISCSLQDLSFIPKCHHLILEDHIGKIDTDSVPRHVERLTIR